MSIKQRALLCAAVIAALCVLILYGGGDVGLSDNGDYRRMMDTEGITYLEKVGNRHLFRRYYSMAAVGDTRAEMLANALRTWDNGFYSSVQNAFVKASKALNFCVNLCMGKEPSSYDIFWLAVQYILLFAAGVYWILSALLGRGAQLAAAGLLLLMFCDSGYILYFNSFYGEALQFAALFLVIGSYLRWKAGPGGTLWTVCLFLGIALFAGAKPVNVIFAMLLGAGACILHCRRGQGAWPALACMAALTLFCGLSYARLPAWMERDTLYQSVFFGIVKDAEDPAEDLRELGLDPAYAALAGTNAYLPEYPVDVQGAAFDAGFYQKINRPKILSFYLRHPGRLAEKLAAACENSAVIRPAYLANSAEEYGKATSRWSLWSGVRAKLRILYRPQLVLPCLLLFAGYSVFHFICGKRRREDSAVILVLLAAGLWLNLLLPVLCNGEADLAKHMFLYIQLMDFWAAALLLWGAHRFTLRQWALIAAAVAVAGAPKTASPGTMEFGVWDGKAICWEIVGTYPDGTAELMSRDILTCLPFDEGGGNLWKLSTLRVWLNTDFMQCFSRAEQARIVPAKRRILLPESRRDMAQGGCHPHYWAYPAEQCDALWETAWYQTVWDKVTLPGIAQVWNIRPARQGGYWLTTPYCGEDRLVRLTDKNGFVLHASAEQSYGVRPVIRVKLK